MTDIDKILRRVRRLDKAGTKGPWKIGDGGEITANNVEVNDGSYRGEDSRLIVAFRDDAPALEAEVRRLRALLNVPYRVKFPSARAIREHAARNPTSDPNFGRRQAKDGGLIRTIDLHHDEAQDFVEGVEDGCWSDMEKLRQEIQAWRPCTPDGMPCLWP